MATSSVPCTGLAELIYLFIEADRKRAAHEQNGAKDPEADFAVALAACHRLRKLSINGKSSIIVRLAQTAHLFCVELDYQSIRQ